MRPAWMADGNCRDKDLSLFFPETTEDGIGPLGSTTYKIAKGICKGCPVRYECLKYALDNHEPNGLWGGLNRGERIKSGRYILAELFLERATLGVRDSGTAAAS